MLLAPLTTLRLGGPARAYVRAQTETEIVAAVRAAGDGPLLVLAGGSNVVIADEGFDGAVVHVATRGVQRSGDARLEVAAGEPWDALVARTVADGLQGFECLSGIPGSAGATPIQNVGAYGQEVAETVEWVRVLDRARDTVETLDAAACGFGYRTSVFKRSDRWVVLAVGFALDADSDGLSGPLRYAELARTLERPVGGRAPLADVRAAVLALRAGKGMVIDPADPDSVSAGSFFTNPVLSLAAFDALAARAGERPPGWPESDGRVKTSAAWLIGRAGFERGHARGRAAISCKHTLALTNRGGASTGELLALAREIADGVRERFGVVLEPEPVLVGVDWPSPATGEPVSEPSQRTAR